MTRPSIGTEDLMDHSVTRQKLAVKGNPGMGKVITMDENGELHWARLECGSGGLISLVIDTHCGTVAYIDPKTGKKRLVRD